jgi:hypothetical protein
VANPPAANEWTTDKARTADKGAASDDTRTANKAGTTDKSAASDDARTTNNAGTTDKSRTSNARTRDHSAPTHRWAAATKGTNSSSTTATATLSGGGIDNEGRKQQR